MNCFIPTQNSQSFCHPELVEGALAYNLKNDSIIIFSTWSTNQTITYLKIAIELLTQMQLFLLFHIYFMAEHFFMYNNETYPDDFAVISSGNRSLRYGDGLFETMKMARGNIINKEFHFERLFNGLSLLQFEIPKTFNALFLEKKIKEIAAKNQQDNTARMRLMLFRGNGGIFDPKNLLPNYIIETSLLPDENQLNVRGLVVDVFPDARKSYDIFSNIKSNNYLPYIMAGLYAKKNQLDDCIILNSYDRICDSAISNIFIINDNNIYTPPLTEGCVAGTMRRWMLEKFDLKKYRVVEKELSINDVYNANEFFLTNATSHLRWVIKFRDKNYDNKKIKEIYSHILQSI
jgi:branched-chain amino acid aminotransferase